MTNSPSPKPPAPNRYNLLAVLGVFGLAVVGVGFLVLAVVLLVRGGGTNSQAVASPTRLAIVSTQVVLIPTTTQSPPTATPAPTQAPTATAPAPSDTPAITPTAALQVTIVKEPCQNNLTTFSCIPARCGNSSRHETHPASN